MMRIIATIVIAVTCAACSRNREPPADVFVAAYEGDLASVKALVEAGADVNGIDTNGQPLLCAALGPHGSLAVVKYLLDQRASPNPKGSKVDTPLMNAAMWVSQPCVSLLLKHGADPDGKGPDGKTALMLIGNDGGDGTLAVLKTLLDAGADPQMKAPDGHTALKQMQRWKHEGAVQYLKSKGVKE